MIKKEGVLEEKLSDLDRLRLDSLGYASPRACRRIHGQRRGPKLTNLLVFTASQFTFSPRQSAPDMSMNALKGGTPDH